MSNEQHPITDASARLAEAHRRTDALSVYSRRVAHDLSNFLTVIRTYSELLHSELPADHASRADLNEITQAADATVVYVQRVSAFSRALSSKVGPLALHDLLANAIQQADGSALAPIALEAHAHCTVTGSAAFVGAALQELLTNAREASPSGAVVTVRTRQSTLDTPLVDNGVPIEAGAWAVVEILDSGDGVPETIAENVFDPFVTGKSGVRGAGLGLGIARAAAWAAGGQLILGREGEHTVARLYLPVETQA